MDNTQPTCASPKVLNKGGELLLVLLIVALGVSLRFDRLGERSLWLDEFSTWHVAQMGLAESLHWGPELTIAPLYQLCVRALTDRSHPPEWLLRLPAAVAGSLVIVAGWWLGRRLGGFSCGVGLALLLACDLTQIHYSQEARPYSMLILGAALSMLLWQQLIDRPTWRTLAAYIVVTTLTAHVHILVALTVLGQAGWWLQREIREPNPRRRVFASVALLAVGILCVPLALRTVSGHADVTAALAWIEPPTALQAVNMLAEVTYGYVWLAVLLAAALLAGTQAVGLSRSRTSIPEPRRNDAPGTPIGLLLWWLGTGWIGLLLISLATQPLMVPRYLLPATIPALLLPLLVAQRLHRYAPLLLAVCAVGTSLPRLYEARSTPSLGFRELVAFLADDIDPDHAVTVNAIAGVEPQQTEMERLAFRYYELPGIHVRDWPVSGGPASDGPDVLGDPRRLHVVAFLADPLPAIHAAGRRIEPFVIDGTPYEQLVFGQYRLLKVAPLPTP